MKSFKKSLFFIIILIVSMASSCRDKPTPSPCDTQPCAKLEGFDCVEGACICSNSKFKVGDYCISSLDTTQYYGTGCTLFDTIVLSVGAYDPSNEEIMFKYRTSSERIGYAKKGVESFPFPGSRYRNNNKSLDSLHFFVDGGRIYTLKDSIACIVVADGRFLEGDKLRLTLRYRAIRQNNRIVDSCEMILHK